MSGESIAITEGTIVTSSAEIHNRTLVVHDGKITRFVADGEPLPGGCRRLSARGMRITPGLIDTHVCGAAGVDCRQGSEAIATISNCLARHGVTSWLPTLYSIPAKELPDTIPSLADVLRAGRAGAIPLGLHLEGPYFVSARRGIARDEDLSTPDPISNRDLLEQHGDLIRMVTLSPDMEGIRPLIEQFARRGIVVASGHTAADKEQIMRAKDMGLSHVTHIFNAMDDRGWVQPGVVKPGSCDFYLLDDSLTASVIGDGTHVLPEILELVLRVKGVQRTVAITDLWPGAGWDGTEMTYITGEEVFVAEDAMRMKADKQLAGGITFLNKCVKNLMTYAGLSWTEAVQTGCLNPARIAGVADRKGDIKVGMDADLLVVDDQWNPRVVIIRGEIVSDNT